MSKKDELREELYGVVQHAELGHYDKPWDAVDEIMQLIDTHTERKELEARNQAYKDTRSFMNGNTTFVDHINYLNESIKFQEKQLQNKSIDGGK